MGVGFGYLAHFYLALHQRVNVFMRPYNRQWPLATAVTVAFITAFTVYITGAYTTDSVSVIALVSDVLNKVRKDRRREKWQDERTMDMLSHTPHPLDMHFLISFFIIHLRLYLPIAITTPTGCGDGNACLVRSLSHGWSVDHALVSCLPHLAGH